MGLAIRIVPTILSKRGQLVKGKRFASDRVVGHALQASRIYNARGVDELCFLDVSATPEGRGPDLKLIEELTRDVFSPVTYGGGIRSVEDVRDVLKAGADKVAICTAAVREHGLIRRSADICGSQAIVAAVDVKDRGVFVECGRHHFDMCGDYAPLGVPTPAWWAINLEKNGAGEILLQSINRDGTMEGYDIELIREVCKAVSIPVIASGGCSGYEDMFKAIEAGASAVAAGALFQFTECTPRGAAEYLKAKGVEVRS